MTQPAIKVQGLSKEYIIGRQQKGQETFREMVAGAVAAPFQRLRKMRGDVAPEERFWALKDINFEVQPGEVVGIIGRNGAGKSTLLKILSRITEPTSGEVQIRGTVLSLLEVGTGFHPELTGRENIFLNGAILGMSRREIERKFDEIVAFAEVSKFVDTQVKRYSSGMQVRLAFSVAAHLEPEILIVDEVLAVGDAAFQKKCLGKMKEFSSTGRTIIFVSHHLPLVRGLCQRVLVLESGAAAYIGDTTAAVDWYMQSLRGPSPVDVDCRSVPRPPDIPTTGGVTLIRARLDFGRGESVLISGEDIVVEFDLEVARSQHDVVLGWALWADDKMLFETRNIDSYPPIPALEPGTYSVRGTVRGVKLAPGEYSIGVGLRNARETLDYLPDILSFRVEAAGKMTSLWFEDKRGMISVQGSWAPLVALP